MGVSRGFGAARDLWHARTEQGRAQDAVERERARYRSRSAGWNLASHASGFVANSGYAHATRVESESPWTTRAFPAVNSAVDALAEAHQAYDAGARAFRLGDLGEETRREKYRHGRELYHDIHGPSSAALSDVQQQRVVEHRDHARRLDAALVDAGRRHLRRGVRSALRRQRREGRRARRLALDL